MVKAPFLKHVRLMKLFHLNCRHVSGGHCAGEYASREEATDAHNLVALLHEGEDAQLIMPYTVRMTSKHCLYFSRRTFPRNMIFSSFELLFKQCVDMAELALTLFRTHRPESLPYGAIPDDSFRMYCSRKSRYCSLNYLPFDHRPTGILTN